MPNLHFHFFRARLALIASFISLVCHATFAITFTNNASIPAGYTNDDGADIVITNCTVTIDGPHSFASLRVAAGGVLTHSPSPNGSVSNLFFVSNEPQVLTGTNAVTLNNSNVISATVTVTDSSGTNFFVSGQDYLVSSPDGVLTQLQRTTNSTIPDGATVLVSYEAFLGLVPGGLNLTVAGAVEIDAGGAINTDGLGYSAGPGAGLGIGPAGGGAYGGNGGGSANSLPGGSQYGYYSYPTNLGSGGGGAISSPGGAGGGSIQITAGGAVTVNGLISANGANGTNSLTGGGSGGGIWIVGPSLSGSGRVTANGGAGEPTQGGGGGGGRIAFQYSIATFTGSMQAYGGLGYANGTAGTVYTQLNGQSGLLVLDNGGRPTQTNTTEFIQGGVNMLIQGNARFSPITPLFLNALTIASNGFLVATPMANLTITASGAITVEAGGGILANGAGNAANTGSGAGHSFNDNLYRPGGGGGYGGNGATIPAGQYVDPVLGGTGYGSQNLPVDFGSGGGGLLPYSTGGSGGGSIQINARTIMQVDGVIAANGANGAGSGGGGGSGGTVSITSGTLLGSGSITAAGGSGANGIGGGGGGGRIYMDPTANLFSGSVWAYGGGGAWGGAGTVLIQSNNQTSSLILDNGGNAGASTLLQTAIGASLIIRGGAVGSAPSIPTFANLVINSNGWLAPTLVQSAPAQGVNFTFTGNATIEAGGGIVANFLGYTGGQGTGFGRNYTLGTTNLGGGAGHGGPGGNSLGNFAAGGGIYDSPTAPTIAGSGGGSYLPYSPGGMGGGIIRLSVTGTLEVDGVISANGGAGAGLAGGGGAGGSIWLPVGTLSGVGSISANGGSGANALGGGGGGGMIYIPCNNDAFNGVISAYGGTGANSGGVGTTVIQTPGRNSQLILDAGGNPGSPTLISINSLADVTLRNGAVGLVSGNLTAGNLLINSNASLLVSNAQSLNCATLTLQSGGSILADALGYAGGSGPNFGRAGSAPNYPCGGGGNSGPGGNGVGNLALGGSTGPYYYEPTPGSGGGNVPSYSFGGAGGGVISITATGAMEIDGTVSANGGNGSGIGGGGGAGGGIALSAGSLGGSGVIRANGGAGANSIGGGGGGGSISLSVSSQANQFIGTISAYGGAGANWGGPGLISMLSSGQVAQLVLDGGGNPATPTPIASSSPANLTLHNGAIGLVGIASSSLNLSNLLIVSNSWLLVTNTSPAFPVTLTLSSATIQAGGGIIADAMGYGPGVGAGAGHAYSIYPNYPCGGGGHGGNGGNGATNLATGGGSYDNQASPVNSGSGGGSYSTYSIGGSGGGACSITVSGLIQLDGVISANGANGGGIGGGGGAGGSIKLTAGIFSGGGSVRANGGAGAASIGGGGGGGCIAIFPSVNLFTGSLTASGGGGANRGGAGTMYMQTGSQSPQLILDNGGQPGTFTQIQSLSANTALILRNGAVGYEQLGSETFASLLITSNAWLAANTNPGPLNPAVNLTITGNATVQAGGGIVADSAGSPSGSGSGAGKSSSQVPSYPCGGGGFGGLGANGSNGLASGGIVYGSVTSPTTLGSGGGSFAPFSAGGSGGGIIRLSITGTLDVSGRISANGGDGSGLGGGGGSGGSILLTVGTLAGGGAITANGGNGADAVGGGGGGGRVSINYTANNFAGLVSTYGGGGCAYGGAGTIYTKANSQSVGPVLVDNGSVPGTSTPLSSSLGTPSAPFNLTIQNGAAVCPQQGVLFPPLNNLTVGSLGLLTGLPGQSTLDLVVLSNLDVAPDGVIAVDGQGYAQQTGAGAGQSIGGYGSGGGYGGAGGASTTAPGGLSYGSVFQPSDFGSGGGDGTGANPGGSRGAGALRLNVGGAMIVDGEISAEGQAGLQNNSGGGSGGSIWASAGTLAGGGLVAADGGEGELYDGGGGAGGRIALYSRTNAFFGSAIASGAAGFFYGADGTVVFSNNVPLLQVLSNSPSGIVSNSVSSAVIYFNGAPNPNAVSASTVSLTTPNGPLASGLTISPLSSSSFQVNFPQQASVGVYTIGVSTNVTDLYGRRLSQTYTGTFVISLPIVQGFVTDTNGNPVAGATLQASTGLSSAVTDTNGNYTLGFVPGSSFTVTPSLGTLVFVPSSMAYSNLYASVSNQNYTAFATLAPVLTTAVSANSLILGWQAIPGVTYQIYSSTDLINWTPYGGALSGSNGTVQVLIPTGGGPQQFFSVKPSD